MAFCILGSDSGAPFIPHRRLQVKVNKTLGPTNDSKERTPQTDISVPLFPMGRIVATPGALCLLEQHGIPVTALLQRHVRGDWGDLGRDDSKANDDAVHDGGRILSSYLMNRDKVWVITEATGDDGVARASTCILKPEEY